MNNIIFLFVLYGLGSCKKGNISIEISYLKNFKITRDFETSFARSNEMNVIELNLEE